MMPPGKDKLNVAEVDLHKILATLEKARTAGAATDVTVHFAPNGGVLSITMKSEFRFK